MQRNRKPNQAGSASGGPPEGESSHHGLSSVGPLSGSAQDTQHADSSETAGAAGTPSHDEATKLFTDEYV